MSEQPSAVTELTAQNFESTVTDHPFAVIDFWAPWCGPCRAFAPVFTAAAAKHPDILFAKVNTEEEQALGASFNIRSIPTLMIFRDNIIVYAEAGALSGAALEQVLSAARELDMETVRRELESQESDQTEPAAAATGGSD